MAAWPARLHGAHIYCAAAHVAAALVAADDQAVHCAGNGDFTGIDSAYRPDPTIGSGLTPDNKGTRFLCFVLTNRSPRKLEARC